MKTNKRIVSLLSFCLAISTAATLHAGPQSNEGLEGVVTDSQEAVQQVSSSKLEAGSDAAGKAFEKLARSEIGKSGVSGRFKASSRHKLEKTDDLRLNSKLKPTQARTKLSDGQVENIKKELEIIEKQIKTKQEKAATFVNWFLAGSGVAAGGLGLMAYAATPGLGALALFALMAGAEIGGVGFIIVSKISDEVKDLKTQQQKLQQKLVNLTGEPSKK